MKPYKVQAHLQSLSGAMTEVTIISYVNNNNIIAEYNGIKCTAIFNPFTCSYYVDDKYGIIKEQTKC